MPDPTRVLIPFDTDLPDTLGIALSSASQVAAASKAREILLLTHTKDQLRYTSLADQLGATAKALVGGQAVSLSTGLTLRHATRQTLKYGAGHAVIIVYYAEDRLLEFVDGLRDVAGVVAVPDVADQASVWAERWNPKIPGQKAAPVPAPILDDSVIENALLSVTKLINLSHTGLFTRDKQWADETLRILRAKGHSAPPDKIKSWAIRNGWTPGAASDLAKLSERIFALKGKPSLAAIHDPAGKYARWSS